VCALAKLDKLNLLEQLFKNIIIPEAVYQEFLRDCPY
jgi:predicted nucleic acid-binding protein